jgi:hypothetical protein
MKKPAEYRQLANECRALARSARNDEHRSQLLKMAEGWDQFAVQSERTQSAEVRARSYCGNRASESSPFTKRSVRGGNAPSS